MKYFKLFEAFQDEMIIEQVFQEFLESLDESLHDIFALDENEITDLDDEKDKELTKGEKAALARGLQIMTEPQLAALYLAALGKSEDDVLKYIVKIDGMLDFAEIDSKTQKPSITLAALADSIGLESTRTMARTVNKFRNLIDGVGETESEVIYPKIIKAFDTFRQMKPDEIANIASSSIQDPSYTVNRDAVATAAEKTAKNRAEAKKKTELQGEKVYTLFKAIKTKLAGSASYQDPVKSALAMSVKKIAEETGVDPEKVKSSYEAYLKSKGLLSSSTFK
jgi:hypothetical protein